MPENKYLLDEVKFDTGKKDIGKEELSPYLRQKPNPGIFGTYKLQLKVYNLSGRDTTKWINRMWRKIGEPPVIFSAEETERSRDEIRKYMVNKGYMNADVKVQIDLKPKKAVVTYVVSARTPYYIRTIRRDIEDDSLRVYLEKDSSNTIIKEGMLFDVDLLETDRARSVEYLRSRGFYYMNKDYLYIEADSALNSNEIDITIKSRPILLNNPDGSVSKLPHRRKKIGRVVCIPWYNSEKEFADQIGDTVQYEGMSFLYDGEIQSKPSLLYNKIHIEPGQYFDVRDVEKTYAAINSLSTTKYVNIAFREQPDDYLDCYIQIIPGKTQGYSVDVEGTNTDGDFGAAVSGTYSHKNIFKSSEIFRLKLRTAYQPMGDISNLLSDNSIEVGGEASLTLPKLQGSFLSYDIRRRIRATTEYSLSYNYQTNPWYARTIAGGAMKYIWVTGSRNNERYSVSLVDLNFVYLPRVSDSFKEEYLNPSSSMRYSYEDHFILSSGFTFSKNTQHPNRPVDDFITYNGTVETGGNTLSAFCALIDKEKVDGAYQIGNIRFSQYVKGEFDFSHNLIFQGNNKVVYRAHVGLAYPYGNADVVPFEKRFYAGGANSVRGWSVRTLGPGIYKSSISGTDFLQNGDIKLDLNLEYRFKLFWVLEGATFVDGGNVWTIKSYDDQQGGEFKLDTFYEQIAYAYGLGLRFDFSFFLFRVDMGIKMFDPSQEKSKQWRYPIESDDFAFHFAIGYPF